jgi:hypothetical protein
MENLLTSIPAKTVSTLAIHVQVQPPMIVLLAKANSNQMAQVIASATVHYKCGTLISHSIVYLAVHSLLTVSSAKQTLSLLPILIVVNVLILTTLVLLQELAFAVI